MEGYWSLVVFTILGQAAAGIMMLSPFMCRTQDTRLHAGTAIVLLAAGALMSLGHLGDPLISFLTISNIGASWLSREIVSLGLFGAATLGFFILRAGWLHWLAGLLGLLFVIVMGNVYVIPAVHFWHSQLTVLSFVSTALLLGAGTALLLSILANRKDGEAIKTIALGGYPPVLLLALGCRLLILPLQLLRQDPATLCEYGIALHIALSFAGAALGALLLVRHSLRTGGTLGACPCGFTCLAIASTVLIWAGEITGRALFYAGFTWFGM